MTAKHLAILIATILALYAVLGFFGAKMVAEVERRGDSWESIK